VVRAIESLSAMQLAAIDDPALLLERAWALEPEMRFAERSAALDRLKERLDAGGAPPAPPGRDWRLELLAERVVEESTLMHIDQALELAQEVLHTAPAALLIARGRTLLGQAQALAWLGTDDGTARARRAFTEAFEAFEVLGHRGWQGSALLRHGYSACFQYGDLLGAKALINRALDTYEPDSPRRVAVFSYYADVLTELGELDAADAALDHAAMLAGADAKVQCDVAGSRARVAAGRRDALATERSLRDAERIAAGQDWFDTHIGLSLFTDGAQLLDRVGLADQAQAYLEEAVARAGEDNEEVIQTRGMLLARTGDPLQALEALQELARVDWLEKRHLWRIGLLSAWATFRAGRAEAGPLAARALAQAVACGGLAVAQAGEPDLTDALAPLAEGAGSAAARELLLAGRELVVRLFGTPSVTRADGTPVALPPGMPGELVRMLALHDHGLPTEVVLEAFFPDTSPSTSRARLRQVLRRLRVVAGDIVLRDGDHLRLAPAWVDSREFAAAANRVRSARGARAVQLAYAAVALRRGPLLPTDPYAHWADDIRERLDARYLDMLHVITEYAAANGSRQEALTALDAAIALAPADSGPYAEMAERLRRPFA
jgi:tetratricopeptide (TPR) repeat protein